MTSIRVILQQATARLPGDEGAAEARLLLQHALQKNSTWLHMHGRDKVDTDAADRYETLLAERLSGAPIAYLTGMRGFWSMDLAVTSDVLIPRPETELLVELALLRIPIADTVDVADLGTGSGAIALALASERPHACVVATDQSEAALAVARGNAERLSLGNVCFAQGDWCNALEDSHYSVIASNPPYIAIGDAHLDRGDLRFEPAMALSSGNDGLDAIRSIRTNAPSHLVDGGWLLLEHGWDQGDAVRALMVEAGFVDVATHRDLGDRDRVTLGCYRRIAGKHGAD
ncbi:MAG: peptide chain release factor N(5)-glutamine methyltransferase [Dokdonella sp.]